MNLFLRYRKIALILCSLLAFVFFCHLIGMYIYTNGKNIGLPGGSISIGVVGDANDPLNPFHYGTGDVANLMYNFLFRSLIRYNSENEIYEGDLANCDLSNLKQVTCVLREDTLWSDGSQIKANDVIATMKGFSQYAGNASMQKFFKTLTVTQGENEATILLSSPDANPAMVEALSYPIIRSDMIDQIENDRLKPEEYITSGAFSYDETVQDTEYGFARISLKKNENYKDTVWLDRLHFKFFKDTSSLERGIETLTVILPPNGMRTIKAPPRFQLNTYNTYEFFGLFFNTDRMQKNLRNIVHLLFKNGLQKENIQIPGQTPIRSLFLSLRNAPDGDIGATGSINFSEFIKENGYKKKWDWLAEEKNASLESTEAIYPKLTYFKNSDGNAVLYSDSSAPNFLLRGTVPKNAVGVTINGYALQRYTPGDTNFSYRVAQEFGNIFEGENKYTLRITLKNNAVVSETLTVYQTTDANKMEQWRAKVEAGFIEKENSPEKKEQREKKKQERIAQIEQLKDEFYYNKDAEPFTLTIAFVESQEGIDSYIHMIESSLRTIGIKVEKQPLLAKDLEYIIKTGKKEYDIILVGVEAPGNIARIGRVFLSTDAGAGVNFSNIKNKNLDGFFGELRAATDKNSANAIQQKIKDFMNEMSFFIPLSSPEKVYYIDRNIKGVHPLSAIPNVSALYEVLRGVSIKDAYHINWEDKSIRGFFRWFGSNI